MTTKLPRNYATVKLDPDIVHEIRVRAAMLKTSIKNLFEEAVRIAGKSDERFRFDHLGGRIDR